MSTRFYMRSHSNVVRRRNNKTDKDEQQQQQQQQQQQLFNHQYEEDIVIDLTGVSHKMIIVTLCRIRQRLLKQAWTRLVQNTEICHDYEIDARIILSRKLADDELRTELEIEVLYNWIDQIQNLDPTSIATSIVMCKRKSLIYNTLQQMRIEFLNPGEIILYQSDSPKSDDGHFTILSGSCDVLQFPDESDSLFKLQYLSKKHKWDEAKRLLSSAHVLAHIGKYSGFGELSTLTGLNRAATIRVSHTGKAEVVVVPKQALTDLLKHRRFSHGIEGIAPSEAMDFMRQSGLAHRISPKDLVRAAHCMIRRTLIQGDILYYKGQQVKSMFLVVSGELLLDTGDLSFDDETKHPQPFINSFVEICYHLSSGSILGDEGVVGRNHCFVSTAVVVSEAAVVFEVVDFGLQFLSEKFGALRYCALAYKDISRWSTPLQNAEELNPYTFFSSLRQSIAFLHPNRGSQHDTPLDQHQSETGDQRKQALYDAYPKHLKSAYLHRALEINKIAKKLAEKSMKLHVKDNILFEAMSKEMLKGDPKRVDVNKELLHTFKKHVDEYRERKSKEMITRETVLDTKGSSSTAVNFFSRLKLTSMTDQMSQEEDEQEGGDQLQLTQRKSITTTTAPQVKMDTILISDLDGGDKEDEDITDMLQIYYPQKTRAYSLDAPKLVIEQYFQWLDILNRHTFRNFMKSFDAKEHSIKEDMKMYQLCVVFRKLSLTPIDTTSSLEYLEKYDSVLNKNNVVDDHSFNQLPHNMNGHSIPRLQLPNSILPSTTDLNIIPGPKENIHSIKNNLSKTYGTEGNHFKTYSPSSWKQDVKTKKKKKETLQIVETFKRSSIPNIRRVTYEQYTFPGQFHPEFDNSAYFIETAINGFGGNTMSTMMRQKRLNSMLFVRDKQYSSTSPDANNYDMVNEIDVTYSTDPIKYLKVIEKLEFDRRKNSLPVNTRYLISKPSDKTKASSASIQTSNIISGYVKNLHGYSKQSLLNKAESIKQKNKVMLYNNENILSPQKQISENNVFSDSFFRDEETHHLAGIVTEDSIDVFQSRRHSVISNISMPGENDENTMIGSTTATTVAAMENSNKVVNHNIMGVDGLINRHSPGIASYDGEYGIPDDKSYTSKNSTLGLDSSNQLFLSTSQISAPAPVSAGESGIENEEVLELKIKSVLENDDEDVLTSNCNIIQKQREDDTIVGNQNLATTNDIVGGETLNHSTQDIDDEHLNSHNSITASLPDERDNLVTATDRVGSPVTTAKRKLRLHKSLAKQRLDEMKAKLLEKAPSSALETFHNFQSKDNNPRQFYHGKKRALAASSYALITTNANINNETIMSNNDSNNIISSGSNKDIANVTEKEYHLFGKEKSSIQKELTLFNSIYMNNTQQHRKKLVEHLRCSISSPRKPNPNSDLVDMLLNEAYLKPVVADKSDDVTDEIHNWQNFTLNEMIKEKTGPKKTLPVLIVKCEGGSSSKRFLVNKSKRWGSGALVPLDAEWNEGQISGPPSFLEVLKHQSKSKLTDKERKHILEELKSTRK